MFDAENKEVDDDGNNSQKSESSLAKLERRIFRGDSIHELRMAAEREALKQPLSHLMWLEASSVETIVAEALPWKRRRKR